jgi:FlaG/FlaF family flagellin (archaellin)
MSLRAFHLLFIAISVILSAFFAAWAAGQYQLAHQAGYVVTCAASLASGVALVVYFVLFQRKTRRLS